MLATILTGIAVNSSNLWTPPGLSTINLNTGIAGLIGLGIVFMIPTVCNAIKEVLKVKPIVPTGTSALFAPITSVYGTAMSGASSVYYLSQMKNMLPPWLGGPKK